MNLNFKYYNSNSLIFIIIFIGTSISILKEMKDINVFFNLIEKYVEKFFNTDIDLLGGFSTITLLTILLVYINKFGWKYIFFKWLVDLPDLNGRYKGELKSSFPDANGNKVEKDCVIEIEQTASSIVVRSYYADKGSDIQSSESESYCVEIIKNGSTKYKIIYFYTNNAQLSQQPGLNNHEGTAILYYYPKSKKLSGEYYSTRLTKGNITANFKQKKLLGGF